MRLTIGKRGQRPGVRIRYAPVRPELRDTRLAAAIDRAGEGYRGEAEASFEQALAFIERATGTDTACRTTVAEHVDSGDLREASGGRPASGFAGSRRASRTAVPRVRQDRGGSDRLSVVKPRGIDAAFRDPEAPPVSDAEAERLFPDRDLGPFRALLVAVPASLLLWAAIAWLLS